MKNQPHITRPRLSRGRAGRRANLAATKLSFRRILVPLDFSGKSRQALDLAVPLAEQYGGKIILAHVVQSPAMSAWAAIPGGGHYLAMNRHNLTDAAQRRLDDMAFAGVPSRVRGQTFALRGAPCDELTSLGERLKVDLIVISTRGQTGLKRILIGSTAERVVRQAGCPVLTVRRRDTQFRRQQMRPSRKEARLPERLARILPWRRILVPIDFSKTSLRALEVAVPLARDCRAQLCLLSVIEPAAYASGFEGVVLAIPDAKLVEDAKLNLPRLARRLVPAEVPVTCWVKRGKAVDVITEVAKAKGIDVIVLTTHGRTGLARVWMGSTAERVVRQADCPVYVVRSFGQNQRKRQRKD